ncbi:MAG: radical SAM family heme chaperone HemW [Pseudomonadota bacterium]
MLLANSWQPSSLEDWQAAGFGLYVHWPFCQAKCPYCDFNSHVSREVDHPRWARAFEAELDRIAAETGPRPLTSIFFGGGTPSLMEEATVAAIIERATALWAPANDIEITLEANPTSVERAKFTAFAHAGVNRISMGIQSLVDEDLRRLGRLHSAREALDAYTTARSVFDRVSFDLIYGRQDQSEAAWENELDEALALGPDHLSLYQLTVEPGTVFGARFERGKLPGLPSEDRGAELYHITQSLTDAAGLAAYETSNHAKAGAECRHNLIYWRYGDFAGVGPGAHGRLTLGGIKYATDCLRDPGQWLQAVGAAGSGEASRQDVPPAEQGEEYLMMGLRLTEGVDLERAMGLGANIDTARLGRMIEGGWLERDGSNLRTTRLGRPLLNAVLGELLA